MKTKEDVLFEVYGRTISPSSEMLKAMDAYMSAFGEWVDEQHGLDTQLWNDCFLSKRPFKFLTEQFLLQQKLAAKCP